MQTGVRRYTIEYGHAVHEASCPEYTTAETGADGCDIFIVIPWFVLPRKKYPTQVYVYAINLYSQNPEMGMRDVAEAARKEFGLSTFSHSTVCRTLKVLEQSILKAGEGLQGCQNYTETATSQDAGSNGASPVRQRRFPSVTDTAERRRKMLAFLKGLIGDDEPIGINGFSLIIVKKWYEKYRRLLI